MSSMNDHLSNKLFEDGINHTAAALNRTLTAVESLVS